MSKDQRKKIYRELETTSQRRLKGNLPSVTSGRHQFSQHVRFSELFECFKREKK
ncbi:adenosine deaminase, partial [Danaus plexippus plexippus]